MARISKKIGLSLGADICWPACYEALVRMLELSVPQPNGDTFSVEVERINIKPFQLRHKPRFDVVIDRLTHWFHTSREWIKKAIIMDHLYVLNNPWSLQSMEKQTSYCAMMHLGLPIPDTWMVPPKQPTDYVDAESTLRKYAKLFSLSELGDKIGYPHFMKPYDGGAWVGVSRVDNAEQLIAAYEGSGQRIMHLQSAVDPFDLFVRCVGVGPQTLMMRYDPEAPLHDRYQVDFNFLTAQEWGLLHDMTMTINGFFGWEFNSCEAMRQNSTFYAIDFANACPDFQVTSLHFYFPEMVKMMVRWSLFCAITERPMRKNVDWEPYYAVQRLELPFRERISAYADITRERFEHERFKEFCELHLSHLDELTWEYFSKLGVRDIVRQKVEALFPAHEVDRFTEHFWGLIQFWRKTEADRMNGHKTKDTSS